MFLFMQVMNNHQVLVRVNTDPWYYEGKRGFLPSSSLKSNWKEKSNA